MKRQLHELSKEELIEVVQDYQEMVSDIEKALSEMSLDPWCGTEIRMFVSSIYTALQKERPGWKIHENENLQERP